MNKSEVRAAIYNGLAKILIPAGFTGKKTDCSFRRATASGSQRIGIPLWDYSPVFKFSVNVSIRVAVLQDLVNPFLDILEESWATTDSIVLGPEYFLGSDVEFEATSEKELEDALKQAGGLLTESVLPFLDRCVSLVDVERLLNDPAGKQFTSRLAHVAMVGVAAAALSHRPDYPEIVAGYRQALSEHIEKNRQRFERLVSHLSANASPV